MQRAEAAGRSRMKEEEQLPRAACCLSQVCAVPPLEGVPCRVADGRSHYVP
jgi:hypothetical protein